MHLVLSSTLVSGSIFLSTSCRSASVCSWHSFYWFFFRSSVAFLQGLEVLPPPLVLTCFDF